MTTRSPIPSDEPRSFATTRWDVVLATRTTAPKQAAEALETLCRSYWYPLYAFVRRQGHGAEDAQDLTQAFFARLLEKDYLAAADPKRGRFRSFLLIALKRFLMDEHDRARAQKRGGGQTPISLDAQEAEDRYSLEPADELSADKVFDRRWALSLLERARIRLREEYVAAGKGALFEELKSFHSFEETAIGLAAAADHMAMPVNTAKSHVHRLRARYRELVRDEIAQTVSSPWEVDDEIRYLLAVVSGG